MVKLILGIITFVTIFLIILLLYSNNLRLQKELEKKSNFLDSSLAWNCVVFNNSDPDNHKYCVSHDGQKIFFSGDINEFILVLNTIQKFLNEAHSTVTYFIKPSNDIN